MKARYKRILTPAAFSTRAHKHFEWMIYLTSYISLIFPLVFAGGILHPSEPTHKILSFYLEIKVTPSLSSLPWIFWIMWGALLITNTIVFLSFLAILSMISSALWCTALTPVSANDGGFYHTRSLGILHNETIITLYRSLQLLFRCCNCVCESFKLTFHVGSAGIVAAVLAFLFVRHAYTLVTSVGGISLILLAALGFSVVFAVAYGECFLIHQTRLLSEEIKMKIIETSRLKSYESKAAKSFTPLLLQVRYPFQIVSKDTFLEYCDSVLDLTVQILVTVSL
ncbi:unnamed protein product [Orchesella dallaii]|uniref:Uncharacterized protein n=1 Tax=Orchesella dallaii TaxID=48710 RepID=A0ABP1RVC6_9HEXA